MTAESQIASAKSHPWILTLRAELDKLELALLENDAHGVRDSSERINAVLQAPPPASDFKAAGEALIDEFEKAAQRFARLRQAVLRSAAQTDRAVNSLMPHRQSATYGPGMGQGRPGGPGQAYLSA
ncbi:hypothetical protein [Hydrogenophaga sp. 5NK40-0174]|uniref:hypothetical protein n=1 Tax=Hydrogenophaga sp. 5NK40-0174 TaxID=3127649 RepID=UPI003101EB6B